LANKIAIAFKASGSFTPLASNFLTLLQIVTDYECVAATVSITGASISINGRLCFPLIIFSISRAVSVFSLR
jgi:hypothetical protein